MYYNHKNPQDRDNKVVHPEEIDKSVLPTIPK